MGWIHIRTHYWVNYLANLLRVRVRKLAITLQKKYQHHLFVYHFYKYYSNNHTTIIDFNNELINYNEFKKLNGKNLQVGCWVSCRTVAKAVESKFSLELWQGVRQIFQKVLFLFHFFRHNFVNEDTFLLDENISHYSLVTYHWIKCSSRDSIISLTSVSICSVAIISNSYSC